MIIIGADLTYSSYIQLKDNQQNYSEQQIVCFGLFF